MTLKHEHCVKWNVKTICSKLVPSLFCQLCHPGGGGGGGWGERKSTQTPEEVVQHADLGSKCAFVHFVTGPVSVIDERLKCYLTNNRKTSSLNRNNETIKSANIVVLQNSTECKVSK